MPPTYVSGGIVGISPRKPCRRRRHFSPRMRVNRFVFLNLPMLKPREPSRRNGFASTPFTCGLRHPAGWQQVTAAWAHAPLTAEGKAISRFLLSPLHSSHMHPGPSGTRRTTGDVGAPDLVRTIDRQAAQQIGIDPVLGLRRSNSGPRRRVGSSLEPACHRAGTWRQWRRVSPRASRSTVSWPILACRSWISVSRSTLAFSAPLENTASRPSTA